MSLWTWKDPGQGALPLRYEPGNWGDILKGEWLCHWLAHWSAEQLVYRDPFCGRPDYPLTQSTADRLEGCPAPLYRRHVNQRLPSSASLVQLEASRLGLTVQAQLSDREGAPDWDIPCQLLLFDPYDFFEHWRDWQKTLEEACQHSSVLVYLYNKSPRGVGQFRNYQELRKSFAPQTPWIGRVAADAQLPRAYHEVWLMGRWRSGPLEKALRQASLDLHLYLAAMGAWQT